MNKNDTIWTDEIEKGSYRMFREVVDKRIRFLKRLRDGYRVTNDLWPGQMIRVAKKRNGFEYYLKEKGGSGSGRYLFKKEQKTVQGIVQRDYDRELLHAAETELKVLEEYVDHTEKTCVNLVYERQSAGRQLFLKRIYPSDEDCLERWEQISALPANNYEKIGDYYTEKGEQVRSKSELLIADALFHAGIPYHYEYPLKTQEGSWLYPDFTILDLENRKIYYWEHFGRMDDEEYINRTLQKIREYEKNGIWPGKKLIMTFESAEIPLGTREIREIIEEYFC